MNIVVRPYHERDAESVQAICLETAAERPFLPVIDDTRLAPFFYAEPYLALEPDSALVAEVEGTVSAYLVATRDTVAFESRLKAHFARHWPALARLHLSGTLRGRHRHWQNQRFFLEQYRDILMRRGSAEGESVVDFRRYPAHCHLQVATRAREQRLGLMLMLRFHQDLKKAGVAGQHCVVMEPADRHGYSRMMQALGFQMLRDTTFTRAQNKALVDPRVWHERILARAF